MFLLLASVVLILTMLHLLQRLSPPTARVQPSAGAQMSPSRP
jgi:hypothetical protein